ncbi:hypothetical protein ACH40D_14820 [Streptomyces olivaceoviridis]|uniref:Peptidase S53 domain-containing protein n=1 Tax=Streptomyces olivaceoviridis TaxID=1921 RepID=A0ABW7V540_STROI|nr:hypothetical protein [Streptomyces corchorusii]
MPAETPWESGGLSAEWAFECSPSPVLPEASFEGAVDFHFNHPGVAFTFASGDNAGVTQYPAASPYVTAVGGTTLTRAQNPRGWAESAGNGTGCGCSLFAPKPAFQHDTTSANRTTADASAVADNFAVYTRSPSTAPPAGSSSTAPASPPPPTDRIEAGSRPRTTHLDRW